MKHIHAQTLEHWVSKKALGKSSASLYPYQCFPAQHLGASADRFLISNRMGHSGPSDAIIHVFHPAPPLQLCDLGPVTLTSGGSSP